MRIVSLVMALTLTSSVCFADCDFSSIVQTDSGRSYVYTKECHLEVGKTLQDNKIKEEQIKDYKKAIELKDLAITKANSRAETWMETSLKLEDNIQKIDSYRKRNDWIYFGLGVITTGLAVWGAGQLK